jgi:tyrosinase
MSNGIVRRPAVPPPVRIRRDVAKLSSSDPILVFYEKAIAVMQQGNRLDLSSSWRYQGAVHDYPSDPNTGRIDERPFPARTNDPNQATGDKFPSDANTFWATCEHGSWFFLSWHRMYLHFFEKIIMKIVANLPDGPKDWALPYWNVSTSDDSAKLPEPFRKPDNITNHLFVRQRPDRINKGQDFLNVDRFGNIDPAKPDTNLRCLQAKSFRGVRPAFGGPARSFHFPDNSGTLEMVPHNVVHNNFGAGSFMFDPEKAALDPIFWLHHSNIDRLWEVWVQRQKQLSRLTRNPKDADADPDSKTWLDGNGSSTDGKFRFRDESGTDVTITSREVLDTRQPPLSYEYEDISDPFTGAP